MLKLFPLICSSVGNRISRGGGGRDEISHIFCNLVSMVSRLAALLAGQEAYLVVCAQSMCDHYVQAIIWEN